MRGLGAVQDRLAFQPQRDQFIGFRVVRPAARNSARAYSAVRGKPGMISGCQMRSVCA
jgi:hypothetical protein